MMIFGFILDRYRKFLLSLRIIAFGGAIMCGLAIVVFPLGLVVPTVTLCGLAGFLVLPIIPICIAFSGEVTFPLDAAMTNGLLQLSGHSIGLLLQLLAAWLVTFGPIACLVCFAGFGAIGALLTCFATEDLRRYKYGLE